MKEDLLKFLTGHPGLKDISHEALEDIAIFIEKKCLYQVFEKIVGEVDEIIDIDPSLDEDEILNQAAQKIASFLGAEAVSIHIFGKNLSRPINFGAFNLTWRDIKPQRSAEESIAALVAREGITLAFPNLKKDERFKALKIVKEKGINSVLAVPFQISAFLISEDKRIGSILVYFKEENRYFSAFEVLHAELLARRLSYDLAKKKILTLYKLNKYKENISDKIFVRLSQREGIKLKDLFASLIPDLEEFLQVKSCCLFSVSKDQRFIRLEAAHPMELAYHKLGYTFTVSHHPYFQTLINASVQYGDFPYERIDPSYLLIKSPLLSRLITPGLKDFARKNNIHSILLIPLKTGDVIRYLIAFYATQQKQYFTNEEIETLTFFAKEIMKALRLEILDDVLHDFKNPAIAITGFSIRAKKLLQTRELDKIKEKLSNYLDIIIKETGRLQDIALQMGVVGREELVDLCEVASERFRLNEAAINEGRMKNIKLEELGCELGLQVYCSRFGLERVLDNLLSNATKAIPQEGGILSMRCYGEESMACLKITNTGEIPQKMIKKIKAGEVVGRGLNIVTRFVHANHGKFDIHSKDGITTIIVRLPLYDIEKK